MNLVNLIFYFVIIIPSSILHEYAHGWMAERLGDPTARYAGRLTLDPRAHIDPWGTIGLPLLLFLTTGFMFAYAKPVPYNPYNLRDQKFGPALVAVAGPVANFLIAAAMGFLIRILPLSSLTSILTIIVQANVLLAVFNLVPIPPLDGSKVLFAILPDSARNVRIFLEQYGFIILLFFIFFLFRLISPLIQAITAFLI